MLFFVFALCERKKEKQLKSTALSKAKKHLGRYHVTRITQSFNMIA